MDKLITLGEVSERVDELSKNCYDHHIPVRSISFNGLDSVNIGSEKHPLKQVAQRSIAFRLGIPYQYLVKCPPELAKNNMEYWLQHERNEQLFFRFDGEAVRAIFTPAYTPVDNFEVMERLDACGFTEETPVQCALDEEFMSLSIPDGKKTFHINGDSLSPGISIANSEVGLSSLHISAYYLRLVCVNGLISKTEETSSYRHVSQKILEEFPAVVKEVSYNLGKQKRQFEISMQSNVDNPEETMKAFNKQFALSEKEREAVEWGAKQEPGNTMFDVVNAYTRAAQFTGLSAASQDRLQRVGGNILAMVN